MSSSPRQPTGDGRASGAPRLQQRRDALARELSELQWDLGGLTYEMAVRDHFRLDVLVAKAARLQEVDHRLREAEHLLRLEATGAAGACPQCGTLYGHGAQFCSNCAFQLMPAQRPGAPARAPDAATAQTAPAAADAPYGVHAPDELEATIAFERPAEERSGR